MADKTKICCIDVDKDIEEYLQEEHEVFSGSFGTRISMPKNAISSNYVLPNYVFPVNIHEYDVFVVDMIERLAKEYYPDDYVYHNNETIGVKHLISERSINVYNPIPYGAYAFFEEIQEKKDKRPIIIVFQHTEV